LLSSPKNWFDGFTEGGWGWECVYYIVDIECVLCPKGKCSLKNKISPPYEKGAGEKERIADGNYERNQS
jgi:hypothetical protein